MALQFKTNILLLFFISFSVFGQEKFITGKLVDSESDEPIIFATIRLKNKAIGVISNMDGGFQIPFDFKTQGDTLQISSMGYKSKVALLRDFVPNSINVIPLNPALEILEEVVVHGTGKSKGNRRNIADLEANEVVRNAIQGIGRNYSGVPFSYVGYYRDYQIKDSLYINLNEALMEVFDRGFRTIDYDATQTRIYEYRRNADFPLDSLAQKPYDYEDRNKIIEGASINDFSGNEFLILRIHDAIRNHTINSFDFVNVFDVDFEENHTFKRESDIILENEKLFVISIDKISGNNKISGKLFVSQNNFAIHKMEYAAYRGGKNMSVNELYKYSKVAGDKFFDVQVEYKQLDGIMYLNYISVSNDFQVKNPPEFKVNSRFVNQKLGCYEIHFSKKPKILEAIKSRKYILRYRGKRVKIARAEVDNKIVRLFVLPDKKAVIKLFDPGQEVLKATDFDLKVKGLVDVDGNLINRSRQSKVAQFREFFVQRVRPKNTAPTDYLYMKKNLPIFKNQPVARIDNFDDYWMNTPLQKLDEKKPTQQ